MNLGHNRPPHPTIEPEPFETFPVPGSWHSWQFDSEKPLIFLLESSLNGRKYHPMYPPELTTTFFRSSPEPLVWARWSYTVPPGADYTAEEAKPTFTVAWHERNVLEG